MKIKKPFRVLFLAILFLTVSLRTYAAEPFELHLLDVGQGRRRWLKRQF